MNLQEASPFPGRIVETASRALSVGEFLRGNVQAVQRRDFKGALWGVSVLALLLFFYVWQHMEVVKIGYEVQALRTERQKLTNQFYYLKYRMYEVESLPRIEKTAREQLGMVTPASNQIVILRDSAWSAPKWLSYWTSLMKKTEGR